MTPSLHAPHPALQLPHRADSGPQWVHTEGVRLALAPAEADAARQRFVRADVTVRERSRPEFSLAFDAECFLPDAPLPVRAARIFSKQQLAQAFAEALQGGGTVGSSPEASPTDVQRGNAARDAAVRRWLLGGGKVPAPRREELVQWLLARLLLARCGDQWTLQVVGGSDSESETPEADQGGIGGPTAAGGDPEDAHDGYTRDGRATDSAPPAYEVDEDPPRYEAASFSPSSPMAQHRSRRASPVSRGGLGVSAPFVEDDGRDEEESEGSRDAEDARGGAAGARLSRRRMSSPRLPRRSPSLVLPPPTAWTDERRRFETELETAKRDIDRAERETQLAERVAELRARQLRERGRRLVEQSRQRREDAERVKRLVADTLEYRSVLRDVDVQAKQARVASRREQERLAQCARLAARPADRGCKGAVLGPGPLSQRELDLRGSSKPARTVRTVYDQHGRRHSASKAGRVAARSDLESAMGKLQRSLLDRGGARELLRLRDRDGAGALSYAEFLRLLRERCATVLTDEQSEALLRHLDPSRNGEVAYGELLWGGFDRRAFLKRWASTRRGRPDREAEALFRRYDRAGRGALPTADFLLALDDLGFRVSDEEAKVLGVRFAANGDGFIDVRGFCAFVAQAGQSSKTTGAESGKLSRHTRRHSLASLGPSRGRASRPSVVADESGRACVDQILAELRELQTTQTRIQQQLVTVNPS